MRTSLVPMLAVFGALAACGSGGRQPVDIAWKGPPSGPPGAAARSGDQSEPRLEALPDSPPPPSKTAELNHAADLSRASQQRRTEGDIGAALQLQRDALAIRERVLGPNHPDVASTLTSLAGLYAAEDDYAAAQPLLERALSIREQALGSEDRLTAESLNNLALLYAAEGRDADAEPLYQRAITIFEHRGDQRQLATTLENYAALLDETGRAEEAKQVEARARAARAKAPTPVSQ
jgi:tetratricopeptide (TPR) repeat protein